MKSYLQLIRKNIKKKGNNWFNKYKCICGKIKLIRSSHVKSGNIKSCGCKRWDLFRTKVATHGMCKTRLFNIWQHMLRRCNNKKSDKWERYGGRGIKVCKQWQDNFKSFYDWSMKNGYSDKLQIDRKNNNGNYKPSNCRWTTIKVNSNNRRNSLGLKKILKIKSLLSKGFTSYKISTIVNVSASHIRSIGNGRCHSNLNSSFN